MKKGESKNMTRFTAVLFILLLIFGIGMRIWQYRWPRAEVVLADIPLTVLVANTPERQHKGLGGKESLEPYDGMLFVFNKVQRQGIVMRDTLFPIDIIWLLNGVVVDIAPNVQTELGVEEGDLTAYYPRTAANTILELPAGWVTRYGLKIGDRLHAAEK